jgi:hypothetical protein
MTISFEQYCKIRESGNFNTDEDNKNAEEFEQARSIIAQQINEDIATRF